MEGVQCRLRVDKPVWEAGEVPEFKADVRNLGKRELIVFQAQVLCELEVDGDWFEWGASYDVRSSYFPVGREYHDIAVTLERNWHRKSDRATLRLSPRKHSVRIAFTMQPTGSDKGAPVRVVSNAVEIEVLADEEKED